MAKREDIETAIWSDPEFVELTPAARLVYIWSFTNQRCGMAGIYRVPKRFVAMETGVEGRRLDSALAELQQERFLFYDGSVMFIRTRVKRLRSRSETIAKSIGSDLNSIGSHSFVALWWQENGHWGWITDRVEKPEVIGNPDGSPMGPPPPTPDPLEGSPGSGKGKGKGKGLSSSDNTNAEGKSNPADRLPVGFPDELTPHLEAALPVLQGLAGRKHANAVVVLSLANTMAAPHRRHKPFVRCAYDCAAHYDAQKQPLRDVVKAYRGWLDRQSDLAGIESLGAPGGNVIPLTRFSEYDRAAGL